MSTEPIIPDVVPENESQELIVAAKEAGLQIETAQGLLSVFSPFATEARSLIKQSAQVTDTKLAKAFRLRLKETRVKIEAARKNTKEESLRTSKAIDGMANVLKFLIEPEENRLLAIEKADEIKEQARKDALNVARQEQLKPFGIDTSFYQLGDMPDDVFAQLLDNSRIAYEAKQAELLKADEERIRVENEKLKEQARLLEENERLKREAQERHAATLKAELEAFEKAKAEEEKQRLQHIENIRVHKERMRLMAPFISLEEHASTPLLHYSEMSDAEFDGILATRKAQKEDRDAAAKAADESAARLVEQQRKADEAAAALRRKADEERIAKEAADKKAAEEAEVARQASLAPDKEKLLAYANNLRWLVIPTVTSEQARTVADIIATKREALSAWIDRECSVL